MSKVQEVKFQESDYVNIKIPENSLSVQQQCAQNIQNTHTNIENHPPETQSLKSGRRTTTTKCGSWAFWCFALIFLCALIIGFVHLGLSVTDKNEKEADLSKIHINHPGSGHQFLSVSQALEQEKNVDFQGIKSFLEMQLDRTNKLISEKLKEIIAESTSSEMGQLKQELLAQYREIKEEIKRNSVDLRGHISALHYHGNSNSWPGPGLTLNSPNDESEKQVSFLKDEATTTNFSSSFSLSDFLPSAWTPLPPPPPITLAPPLFYQDDNFKGAWFEPSSGWEEKCVNFPDYFKDTASSVKLGGHCLLVCSGYDCKKNPWIINGISGKECLELHPKSYGLEDFQKIKYNDDIRSFSLCQKTLKETPDTFDSIIKNF